jgi:hypothetical protein
MSVTRSQLRSHTQHRTSESSPPPPQPQTETDRGPNKPPAGKLIKCQITNSTENKNKNIHLLFKRTTMGISIKTTLPTTKSCLSLDSACSDMRSQGGEITRKRKGGRKVSFGELHVREYGVVLGDHPCCESFPLSLGWTHGDEHVSPINPLSRSSDDLGTDEAEDSILVLGSLATEDGPPMRLYVPKTSTRKNKSHAKRLTHEERRETLLENLDLGEDQMKINAFCQIEMRQRRMKAMVSSNRATAHSATGETSTESGACPWGFFGFRPEPFPELPAHLKLKSQRMYT